MTGQSEVHPQEQACRPRFVNKITEGDDDVDKNDEGVLLRNEYSISSLPGMVGDHFVCELNRWHFP